MDKHEQGQSKGGNDEELTPERLAELRREWAELRRAAGLPDRVSAEVVSAVLAALAGAASESARRTRERDRKSLTGEEEPTA